MARDLEILKNQLQNQAKTPKQKQAVIEVAMAEDEAKAKNGPKMIEYLKKGGKWTLDTATEIGTNVAAEVIKKALLGP